MDSVEERRCFLGDSFVLSIRVSREQHRCPLIINVSCLRDGLAPYAESSLLQLVSQQPYDVLLHLVVPATESNLALGNFMASLRLSSDSNQTLAVVRRPVRIC